MTNTATINGTVYNVEHRATLADQAQYPATIKAWLECGITAQCMGRKPKGKRVYCWNEYTDNRFSNPTVVF